MASNYLRDFLTWDTFTPGTPTAGGIVTGALPNTQLSAAGLLSINTTTGVISAGFPSPPSPYTNGWLVEVALTVECIGTFTAPQDIHELIAEIVPVGHGGSIYFEYVDWGDFLIQSYANQTVTTRLRGAYTKGGLTFTLTTAGIATIGTDLGPAHRRVHISFNAVAY